METRDAGRSAQVLVVDDNAVVRRLLTARLRSAGCRVTEAADGLAALAEFERLRPRS